MSKQRQNQRLEYVIDLTRIIISAVMEAYFGMRYHMLTPARQLADEKRCCHGFSAAHVPNDKQLTRVEAVIPLDELLVRQEKFAGFICSNVLQGTVVCGLVDPFLAT